VLVAVLAAAGACRGPRLVASATPKGSTLLVDGRTTANPATRPFRYYGTTELRALPAPPGADGELPHVPSTIFYEIPAPAPKWLFPFDFLIEVASLPWTGVRDGSAAIAVTPNPEPVVDDRTTPRGLDDLRGRASRARAARE